MAERCDKIKCKDDWRYELMINKNSSHMAGILLTLLGAMLWGICGSCGQYLFQYKEVTSNWLVPFRLTIAGAVILILLLSV